MVKRRGTTIFFSTHVMELAERFCDQVGIINKGQLAGVGGIPELRQRASLPDDTSGVACEALYPRVIGPKDLTSLFEKTQTKSQASTHLSWTVERHFHEFMPSDQAGEVLLELKEMIAHTNLSRGLFFSNHASNYLPIKARMPKGKQEALDLIDGALKGEVGLRPEWMRAL